MAPLPLYESYPITGSDIATYYQRRMNDVGEKPTVV